MNSPCHCAGSIIGTSTAMATRSRGGAIFKSSRPMWRAARFRAAGDEDAARTQELVGREEIAHVRFGARWFEAFTGGLDFDRWREALPEPLSPMLMRGRTLDRDTRARAGFPGSFLDRLDAATRAGFGWARRGGGK